MIEGSFTLVFNGDIRDFKANPLRTETPFGVAYAAGIGDAFEEQDALKDLMEKAIKQIEDGEYDDAISTLMEQV